MFFHLPKNFKFKIYLKNKCTPVLLAATSIAITSLYGGQASGQVPLSDQPVFASSEVPGNLALALSVEYPTATRVAHTSNYNPSQVFAGYFDTEKCYQYVYDARENPSKTADSSYFNPVGAATNRTCSGLWSGNFLNWATTAAIDPFRWAMTGGRRVVDTTTETIIEKGYHSGQGNYFGDRSIPAQYIGGATPFTSSGIFNIRVNGMGFKMRFALNNAQLFTAQYFKNTSRTGTPVTTVTKQPAEQIWNSPPIPTDSNSVFSSIFSGTFTAPVDGKYKFRIKHDDGAILWVNNKNIYEANSWTSEYKNAKDVSLKKNEVFTVKIEQWNTGGAGGLSLQWALPGEGWTSFSNGAISSLDSATAFSNQTTAGTYDATIRVKVCDATVGLESNCVKYGDSYKPEGLVQQYAQKMRFSAFGYLNQNGNGRDGGVLRARQKFVGPTYPRPGESAGTNSHSEWDTNTGIMTLNPDASDATDTTSWAGLTSTPIVDSGVMNYLNKFGQLFPGNYKSNDPVNELYYAALRYFRGLNNISAWTDLGGANETNKKTYLDGFPVIRNWTEQDPIQYACQRNFILGIGDIYTHSDKNVPGGAGDGSPKKPEFNDFFEASKSTSNLKKLQGLGAEKGDEATGSTGSTDYMAGLAFEANSLDIRPDDINKRQSIGKQTVQTYWVDVLEQPFSRNNKFYLAAKFGGLDQSKLPNNFDPYTYEGDIPRDWWSTNGETLTDTRDGSTWPRPNNYFTAGSPDAMISGLQKAFQSIANEIRAYTTSFSYTSPDITSGDVAYASQYDSSGWSGAVTARRISYDASTGRPSMSEVWNTDSTLTTQLANNGWDTGRRIVTWNASATTKPVPFRYANLNSTQKQRLNPSYTSGNDAENYLKYLRGQKINENSSTDSTSTRSYRTRSSPLADIVGSKITAVGKPSAILRDAQNPGYSAFKTAKNDRTTMVYVGVNDGMMHAFYGKGDNAGKEAFAYIPSDMFNLTYAQSSTTGQDGPDSILSNLGNPNYQHRYSVDATPVVFDVDFNRTYSSTSTTPDWRSILIGGLGKGGRSFYAIDVTTPSDMTTESAVAGKVLWEFTDSDMGFSFGAPVVVKTNKYGWVVLLTSGYNNSDDYGYLYVVHPKTGALLEKIKTKTAAPGMAYASAFIPDFGDGTTDSVYAGDLNGTIWRFDLTGSNTSTAYPLGAAIAKLQDKTGNNLAVTTAPLIEVHPDTRFRYVMVGTGKLLDIVDVTSAQEQTFFAIKDGTAGAFKVHASPVARASLRQVTDLTNALSLDMNDSGWYLDLGKDDGSGVGWRVIAMPVAASDVVAFTSMLTTGDACSPAGVSRVYAINFAGGKTALSDGKAFVGFDTSVTDLKLLEVDGKIRLIAGDNQGNIESIDITIGFGNSLRILNWRETFSFD